MPYYRNGAVKVTITKRSISAATLVGLWPYLLRAVRAVMADRHTYL